MSYTVQDLQRESAEYKAWAKERDRQQFLEYMQWLRENIQRIHKEEGIYESECRVICS